MSTPQEEKKVKMITSIFSREEKLIQKAILQMKILFGPTDWISETFPFNRTRYYAKEMGWPLYRKFISFSRLIYPDSIVDIKLTTNNIENEHRFNKKRQINIDPGYISLERLVLATGKNYTHRIYLTKGIYADLTLVFQAGTFHPLLWTYPDYKDEAIISCFNMVRNNYLQHLRQKEQ